MKEEKLTLIIQSIQRIKEELSQTALPAILSGQQDRQQIFPEKLKLYCAQLPLLIEELKNIPRPQLLNGIKNTGLKYGPNYGTCLPLSFFCGNDEILEPAYRAAQQAFQEISQIIAKLERLNEDLQTTLARYPAPQP